MADLAKLIAQPESLHLATGVEGQIEIGGSILYPGRPQDLIPAEFNVQGLTIDIDPAARRLVKNGNPSDATGIQRVSPMQPLRMEGFYGPIQSFFQSSYIGLVDNLGRHYWVIAYSNAFDGAGWHYSVVWQDVDVVGGAGGIPTPISTGMAVYTDGRTIYFVKDVSGLWTLLYSQPIPSDVTDFRLSIGFFSGASNGSSWQGVTRRIDDAIVPINTNNAEFRFLSTEHFFEERIVDITHYGILADAVGSVMAEISVPDLSLPTQISIDASALYIRPQNGSCGDIVLEGQTIQFESNGGQGGSFEATSGTILSGLRWQAPSTEGDVTFTYTIGSVVAVCLVRVVAPLSVQGIDEDGFYPDLAQGEVVQFQASCDTVQWSSEPNGLIVRRGLLGGRLVAPTDALDDVFGEKIVTITVVGCGQQYSFKVRIQPMYPTPNFCGPVPIKWTQHEPDFLPNRLVMTGGTSQVKNRNAKGINLWDIEYDLLPEKVRRDCTCSEGSTAGHLPGCTNQLATANRLSNFYRQVKMTNYFSIVDYQTGVKYKYVRLTAFERSHTLFLTEQARKVSMRQEGEFLGTESATIRTIPSEPQPASFIPVTNEITVEELVWIEVDW